MQLWFLNVMLAIGLAVLAAGTARGSDSDIESNARLVCTTTRGTKKQITSVEQIRQLAQFFRGITKDSKLFACRNAYLESIEDLEQVVNTENENACGKQKLELVEVFHRHYVSKLSSHRKQRRGNKAPTMVKLFFMQYATKLSSICEQNAVSFLEKNQHPISDEEVNRMNQLKRFTDAMGMSDLEKGYKGTYLFWNMIDAMGSSMKFGKHFSDNTHKIRANIQLHDGRPLRTLQALCEHKLKSVYSQTVLPVLRLVDMGYYPQSGRLLNEDSKMRSVFLATQICETLLPVRVYDDPEKLAEGQSVILTRDEAAELPLPDEIPVESSTVYVEPASVGDLDVIVQKDDARALADVIKANVADRAKIVGKMFKVAMKRVKEKLSSKLGAKKLHLFTRGPNKKLQEVDNEAISKLDEEKVLEQHHVEVEHDEDEDDNDHETEGKRLVKRESIWFNLGIVGGGVLYIIYLIILLLIKLAIFGLPSIALLIAFIGFDIDKAGMALEYIWKFGYNPLNPIPDDVKPY